MRIVVDANIFVSFILTGGETISSIFNLWRERKFIILSSQEIRDEIKAIINNLVLAGSIKNHEAQELIARLESETEFTAVYSKISLSRDKKDNRYLACAKDGQADYLITGDKKHLLPLKRIGKTRIISPKDFLKLFQV